MKKTRTKILLIRLAHFETLVWGILTILLLFYFDGHTPLTFAARYDQPQVIKLLLENKANIDHQEKNGCTALMFAAYGNHPKVVEILLKNNATVDLQDETGWTALLYATAAGQWDITHMLLQHDTDPYIKNNDGKNALDLILSSRSSTEHEKEQFKQKMLTIIENKKLTA